MALYSTNAKRGFTKRSLTPSRTFLSINLLKLRSREMWCTIGHKAEKIAKLSWILECLQQAFEDPLLWVRKFQVLLWVRKFQVVGKLRWNICSVFGARLLGKIFIRNMPWPQRYRRIAIPTACQIWKHIIFGNTVRACCGALRIVKLPRVLGSLVFPFVQCRKNFFRVWPRASECYWLYVDCITYLFAESAWIN